MPLPSPIPRLLLTGAAGALGRVLRPALKPHAAILRVSDRAPLGDAGPGEETIVCDLADADAMKALLAGVDAVVHMGGFATDGPMATIFAANIVGVQNLYEAARLNKVKRIVFASSNHVIGFYPRSQRIDTEIPARPDSYYGVSKAFGEDLSRYYFDRCGIETVCLRIGSARAAPTDRRMLSTWLSYGDLVELVIRSLLAPKVDHTIVYGVSANKESWWDNGKATHLEYRPRDNAEDFRSALEKTPQADPADPASRFQGGGYVVEGPFP